MITFEDIIKRSETLPGGCLVYIYTPKIRVLHKGRSVYFFEALADSAGKEYEGVTYRKCCTPDCINPDHLMFTKNEKFWSNINVSDNLDTCWEWKSVAGTGRYAVSSWKGKSEAAHRIAFRLTNHEIPNGLEVCHKCDNPPCCNPYHLFIGTHQDNVDDRERKGRNKLPHSKGEEHGLHKLTENEVKDIRILYTETNRTYLSLSRIYQVSPSAIRDVIKGKNWGWLS